MATSIRRGGTPPMTVDLREELLTAAPGVPAAFAALFDRLAEARRISASVASPSPKNAVVATMETSRSVRVDSGSIESVRAGRVDVVVSVDDGSCDPPAC